MLIALRGHWGEPYPWHTRGGIVTEGVLRALNIPFEYARAPKEVGRQIREAYTFSQSLGLQAGIPAREDGAAAMPNQANDPTSPTCGKWSGTVVHQPPKDGES